MFGESNTKLLEALSPQVYRRKDTPGFDLGVRRDTTENSQTSPSQKFTIETVAKSLAAMVATILATGFLIILTYTGRLGMHDSDFFKSKYVLVGVFYWLIPILFGLPIFAWSGIHTRSKRSGLRPTMTLGGLLTTLQLLIFFYVVALVAPPGFLSTQFHFICVNLALTTLGLGVIYGLIRRLREPETHRSQNWFWRLISWLSLRNCLGQRLSAPGASGTWRIVRWTLLAGVLLLDVQCLWPLMPLISAVLLRARIPIAIFAFMGHLIYQFRGRTQRAADPDDKRALWYLAGAMLLPLYIFSVIGFAYAIYPFIPAERGGANYIHSPNVVVWISDNDVIPASLIDVRKEKVSRTQPMKLIEQTPTTIYIAPRPASDRVLRWNPHIYSVPRQSIAGMEFEAPDEL